ncbi:hypothetical protein Slip_1607 [Syntrophothermus lipocalidus DSM 12680]|uniref:Uncharacterized protein n=1 Tax=Syntrophothermus lipocalidus (strain DSM 12680 / TGB-C1) TaxID=643648 RepID=D7CNT3_SYNLT|nr:hypothetical protein Slip_1607 [Syntrophothermus lipocalidus DSM 12680]
MSKSGSVLTSGVVHFYVDNRKIFFTKRRFPFLKGDKTDV